jgi:DNA-3-methyladenine glycosylase
MELKKSFFKPKARVVARELIGKVIEYKGLKGMITETEAYENDEASHAFKRTKRSALMHDSHGKFYIYFIYGNYYCLNITTDEKGPGAVLIRGLKPLEGISLMKKRRNCDDVDNLLNGPGKICQAFDINKKLNGRLVNDQIKILDNNIKLKIERSERIGIKKATNLKWRFFAKE